MILNCGLGNIEFGKPIDRAEALDISRRIIEQAENERCETDPVCPWCNELDSDHARETV